MHGKPHVVGRLDAHLPGQQTVLFGEDYPQAAVDGLATAHTKLTAYFELVKAGWRADGERAPDGGPLYYADVPRWYAWGQKNRAWKPRVRRTQYYDKVIGRLYSVPPRDSDRFFLRMLLLHVPNAEGFEGTNGLKPSGAATWRAAAEMRGLAESSGEYHDMIEEACTTNAL